jgi:hypothetical protein
LRVRGRELTVRSMRRSRPGIGLEIGFSFSVRVRVEVRR